MVHNNYSIYPKKNGSLSIFRKSFYNILIISRSRGLGKGKARSNLKIGKNIGGLVTLGNPTPYYFPRTKPNLNVLGSLLLPIIFLYFYYFLWLLYVEYVDALIPLVK